MDVSDAECLGAFQQQANMDEFEVKLKQEQDERTRAQTKLSEIMVRSYTCCELHLSLTAFIYAE